MTRDYTDVPDLETARRLLIAYDETTRKCADEIERLREGLRKIRGGLGDPISNLLPHEIAQAALQQKESE